MSKTLNAQGAGHDFSPRGRKMLWGVPHSSIIISDNQKPNIEPQNKPKLEKPPQKPEVTITKKPRTAQVNYILKPKSRSGQKRIKATGDFKPPHVRISRQISSFVTLDQTGNRVSYYRYKPSLHPKLPSYIKQEEISDRKIKRCTLHSYLQCGKSTVDKKNCNVCVFFKEKSKDEKL